MEIFCFYRSHLWVEGLEVLYQGVDRIQDPDPAEGCGGGCMKVGVASLFFWVAIGQLKCGVQEKVLHWL